MIWKKNRENIFGHIAQPLNYLHGFTRIKEQIARNISECVLWKYQIVNQFLCNFARGQRAARKKRRVIHESNQHQNNTTACLMWSCRTHPSWYQSCFINVSSTSLILVSFLLTVTCRCLKLTDPHLLPPASLLSNHLTVICPQLIRAWKPAIPLLIKRK